MIVIVTKLGMLGGSERRAIELYKTIQQLGGQSALVATGELSPAVVKEAGTNPVLLSEAKELIETAMAVIVICSDSKDICTPEYWQQAGIDTSKPNRWLFIFNFLISSSIPLGQWKRKDMVIAATSRKFFDEVGQQDRYKPVRALRRIVTRSPISKTFREPKTVGKELRIACYGKSNTDKWNGDLPYLIEQCYEKYGTDIIFLCQGAPQDIRDRINKLPNAEAVKENHYEVRQILRNAQIFLYYPTWKREEPWARCIGESMMAGCPVITTAKGGNLDQVIDGNTGYLCHTHDDFLAAIDKLHKDRQLLAQMSVNAMKEANSFESLMVTAQLMGEVDYEL